MWIRSATGAKIRVFAHPGRVPRSPAPLNRFGIWWAMPFGDVTNLRTSYCSPPTKPEHPLPLHFEPDRQSSSPVRAQGTPTRLKVAVVHVTGGLWGGSVS